VLYPKNANVTAAVALAGVGFERTQVRLIADPAATGNGHALMAEGAFGRFRITLDNAPLPDNPKTSWLAALSVEREVLAHFSRLRL
jgi:aspartate dehydrogenase